ncbi:MAG: VOC family protein [Eubacteriaceae bacterium]|nr:VOC family protein [Eubacteriaceae bacterium]
MEFRHVTISVKDMQESLSFYKDIVGLEVVREFASGPSQIVFLASGGTQVELIYNAQRDSFSYGSDISLGFASDSLDDTAEALKKAGFEPSEVSSPQPTVKFFFVSDPNGVRIQFISEA